MSPLEAPNLKKKYVRGESKIKGNGLMMFNKFDDLKQLFISRDDARFSNSGGLAVMWWV